MQYTGTRDALGSEFARVVIKSSSVDELIERKRKLMRAFDPTLKVWELTLTRGKQNGLLVHGIDGTEVNE